MNFSKYGFDRLSRCFPQIKTVYISGVPFTEHLSNDASVYLQYLSKKTMNKKRNEQN